MPISWVDLRHLQSLNLDQSPLPGLPKLLLSATHLVHLCIWSIPHLGYFSPEAIATSLSVLTRLESLRIEFKSPQSRPDRRRPPPPTRAVLPALTILEFRGVSEYLEDVVARIDAPLLDKLEITFFHQLLFDTPRLSQFISRTPKFKAYHEARVAFCHRVVSVTTFDGRLRFNIMCRHSDWQLSCLAQICSSSFPQTLISTIDHLYIEDKFPQLRGLDIEGTQWLEFLHPFTAVKDLYISPSFMPSIAPALQELVGERVTEVLPALQSLLLEGLPAKPVQQGIEKFVAARQFAGHSIAISRWGKTVAERTIPFHLTMAFPTGLD